MFKMYNVNQLSVRLLELQNWCIQIQESQRYCVLQVYFVFYCFAIGGALQNNPFQTLSTFKDI